MKKRLALLSVEREPRASGPALAVVSLQKTGGVGRKADAAQ